MRMLIENSKATRYKRVTILAQRTLLNYKRADLYQYKQKTKYGITYILRYYKDSNEPMALIC